MSEGLEVADGGGADGTRDAEGTGLAGGADSRRAVGAGWPVPGGLATAAVVLPGAADAPAPPAVDGAGDPDGKGLAGPAPQATASMAVATSSATCRSRRAAVLFTAEA